MILKIMSIFSFFALILISRSTFASNENIKTGGLSNVPKNEIPMMPAAPQISLQTLLLAKKFNLFASQGVPAIPLKRSLEFLMQSYGRTLMLKGSSQLKPMILKNDRYMAIADYSLPSTEKRFYLLDLKNGTVEKHYVSHGQNTGFKWAQKFSNNFDSKQTSLGFYLTGETYKSPAFGGTAMKVYGMEATNFNAYARYIVIHQADYATPEFIEERKNTPGDTGRLGRSHGCFALDPDIAPEVIEKLKGGALIYAYTKGAENIIAAASQYQEVLRVTPGSDFGIDTEEEILQRAKRSKTSQSK